MNDRPFDLLTEAIGKGVLIELKDGVFFRGILLAYDVHMNVVLEQAEKLVGGEVKNKYGKVLLRGDNVLLISP